VIQKGLGKLNAMTLRERAIIIAAVIGVIIYVWYTLLMQPVMNQKSLLQNQISEKQSRISGVEKLIKQVRQGKKIHPRAGKRARIASLRSDIDKLNGRLKRMTGGMVEPTQMGKVLEGILTQDTNLSLVSIETLGNKPLIDSGGKKPEGGAIARVYMHGVRIRFKGGYLDMLSYLKALERLPWRLFWGGIDYEVKDYPEAYCTLDVYTLSLKEGWIGV
jgi:MSHA biogenesis protein MshJ